MTFKEFIFLEAVWIPFNNSIEIGINDNGKIKFYNINGIDMRFEDYSLDGLQAPLSDFSVKIYARSGKPVFLNFQNSKVVFSDKNKFNIIPSYWSSYAEFYNGNAVVKSAKHDVFGRFDTLQNKKKKSLEKQILTN